MKYWEIVADNLSRAGWSWGICSTVTAERKTIFVADARDAEDERLIVRSDEILSAFLELERQTRVL